MGADIAKIENLLFPHWGHFADDARAVINAWTSANVLACPGSGKTTVLLAKLKILADQMPLKSGRGICVLSHTNVAVNEIKDRLPSDATKIMSYPNFVGTIHSFVDVFVTFPFIRNRTRNALRFVDDGEFAALIERKMWNVNYQTFAKSVSSKWQRADRDRFVTKAKLIERLSLDDELNLCCDGSIWVGHETPTAIQYSMLKKDILEQDGVLCYADSYVYAKQAIKEYGERLRAVLSKRFMYVFIDEFQDCSADQRNLIDALFEGTDTVVQKIGDKDQAIYNGLSSVHAADWNVSEPILEISQANRYGSEIANVLTCLRAGKRRIVSMRGASHVQPTLLVYTSATRTQVVERFIQEIKVCGLPPNGKYKAIGTFKNLRGTQIGSYWDGFVKQPSAKDTKHWDSFVHRMVDALRNGELSLLNDIFCSVGAVMLRLCQIMNGRRQYTKRMFRRDLHEKCWAEYSDGIINLARVRDVTFVNVDTCVRELLRTVFKIAYSKEDVFSVVPAEFMASGALVVTNPDENIYQAEGGYAVRFDTVYGAKGETHDATLYLETEYYRKSDLCRVMPLFDGADLRDDWTSEQCRRRVYVGLSRPSTLLCVAMSDKTYKGHDKSFEAWKVIKL